MISVFFCLCPSNCHIDVLAAANDRYGSDGGNGGGRGTPGAAGRGGRGSETKPERATA